jgi:murein DD-endopeptidase MepM/ murein hydrolase activator NlpD
MPGLKHPMEPVVLTQHFGERPAVYAQFGMRGHNGLDYRTRFLDSPLGHRYVTAAASGKILEMRDEGSKGYGKYIRIGHPDGSQTVYGHLYKFYVGIGKQVAVGQRIGLSDSTGFSSGPHLHFGYRPPGWEKNLNNGFKGYVDPLPYIV